LTELPTAEAMLHAERFAIIHEEPKHNRRDRTTQLGLRLLEAVVAPSLPPPSPQPRRPMRPPRRRRSRGAPYRRTTVRNLPTGDHLRYAMAIRGLSPSALARRARVTNDVIYQVLKQQEVGSSFTSCIKQALSSAPIYPVLTRLAIKPPVGRT
jgi:hypothetical protein